MKRDDWTTLSGRLVSAMREAAKDDKAVAKEVSALAKKKISWQTIQGIRNGTTLSSVYIAHIADVLKCNAVWLAVGKGKPYDSQLAMGSLDELTPAAVEVARRWQSLDPKLRQRVYEVLLAFESLAESGAVEQPASGRKPKEPA